jgi:serine/threonine protein kinase
MEYYSQTLIDVIARKPKLEEKLILSGRLASAVSMLASVKHVHRDIKPSNILVSGSECVLGDFGIVRVVGDVLDHSPKAMARYYPSPELLAYSQGGDPPGPASDVFQLGVVLTELFTRRSPISVNDGRLTIKPLGDIAGIVGRRIVPILSVMLDENAKSRPTAAAVALEFTRLLQKMLVHNVAQTGRAL